MNEDFKERAEASIQEDAIEKTVSLEQSFSEGFTRIDRIQRADEVSPMVIVDTMANRLDMDVSQKESAKGEVNFDERAVGIEAQQQSVRTRFQKSLERAFLPIATALALHAMPPALAQESNEIDSATVSLETRAATKSESSELKPEDVFKFDSPLYVISEKMKALKKEMSPEVLALVKNFHGKALSEKHEQGAVSGMDSNGKFIVNNTQGNRFSVTVPTEFLARIKDDARVTHIHPRESNRVVSAKEGSLVVLPPSAGDIISACMDIGNQAVSQVVDSRGVWEYHCDDKNPFIQDVKKALDEGESGIIEKVSKFITGNRNFGLSMLSYELGLNALVQSSAQLSDEAFSKKLKSFIQGAEERGIYMSYTPFKTVVEEKEMEQE